MTEITETGAALTWADANHAHLADELHRMRLLLRRKVRWLRQNWQQDPLATHRGLVISDGQADKLLADSSDDQELDFYRRDSESIAITAALAELERHLVARRQRLTVQGEIPALESLLRSFSLGAVERDVLLLCFAGDDDPGFATLCAYVQDDAKARYVTPNLVLDVLCLDQRDRPVARAALGASATLRHFRLIRVIDAGHGLPTRILRIDERIADYVRGINRLDPSLLHILRQVPRLETVAAHRTIVDQLVRWASSLARRGWPPINLTGPTGAGKTTLAVEFCDRAGLQLYTLDLRRLPLQDAERYELLHMVQREAVLLRIALYVDVTNLDLADRALSGAAREWMERYGGVLFVGGRERWKFQRDVLHIEVPKLTSAEQHELWTKSLQGIAQSINGQIEGIVQQFDFGPGAIPQTVSAAVDKARARSGDGALAAEDLWHACREYTGWQLECLAERLTPGYTWDDIVLPEDITRQVREIADQVTARAQVYEKWGFSARLPRGRGIAALFTGPSGTGKTMAAEILANHLQLDLYRIDLAGVVSKYIGETEKNLAAVFTEAERSGAVLLFDEADALFGKRSDVRDSNDRYANLEVSYLLQRIEEFGGLAILATNARQNIDEAFVRRLRFVVEFPPKE